MEMGTALLAESLHNFYANAAKTMYIMLSLSAWMSMSMSVDCPNKCECGISGERIKVKCPNTDISVYMYTEQGIVVVDCKGSKLTESMLRCPRFPGNVTVLQLENCAVDSVHSLLRRINAPSLTDLCLIGHQTAVTKEMVQELNALNFLVIIDSVAQKVVPVEALKVLPRMRVVWLYNAGLTDIPTNTFYKAGQPLYQQWVYLSIALNNITYLRADAFNGLDHIKRLSMWGNNMQQIDVDAFRGLDSLTTLDMTNESIALPVGVFRHKHNLTTVIIKNNRVEMRLVKGVMSSSSLPRLETLILSGSKKLILGPSALSNLPSLQTLDLSGSSITELPEDVFGNSILNSLNLRNNRLRSLPAQLFAGLVQLSSLDISNNTVEYITTEMFGPLVRLKSINMTANNIKMLPEYLFSSPVLGNLFFSKNSIQNIGEDTFQYATHLDLSYNQLDWPCRVLLPTSTNPTLIPSSLNKLKNLVHLDLSHNYIEGVCSDWLSMLDLMDLNLSNNRLESIWEEELAFSTFQQLNVNFDNNFISTVAPLSDPGPNKTFHFNYNPFNCDCHLYTLLKSNNINMYNLSRAQCSEPQTLKHQSLLSFADQGRLDDLTCSVDGTESCVECLFYPNRNRTECICQDTLNTPSAKSPLDNKNITLKLKLQKPVADFSGLTDNGTVLDMSGLKLESIPEMPPTVAELDLRNNSLRDIPLKVLNSNVILHLANNPLRCDCWGADNVRNLKKYRVKIHDYKDIKCEGGSYVEDNAPESLCHVYYSIVISVSCISAVIILLLTMFFAYNYIPEVQVLLLHYGLKFLVRKDWLTTRNFKHDIYISYATENEIGVVNDETFVIETLVPELTRMGYKVFGSFDFELGARILDQIYDSVRDSKITLFTISNAFINNVWSLEELRSTLLQGIIDKSDRIMFILLEDFKLTNDESHSKLKALLTGYTCIKRDSTDERFFKRLRKRLHKRLNPKEVLRRQKALRTLQALGIGSDLVLTGNGELYKENNTNTDPAIRELQVLVPKND